MKAIERALVGVMLLGLGGCVVHEQVVARPAPPCAGAFWVEGHYGENGRWHAPHWACPEEPEPHVQVILTP